MQTASSQIEELLIPVTPTTPLSGFAELYELHSEAVFRAALPRLMQALGTVEDLEEAVETVADTVEPLQGITNGVGRVRRRLSSSSE